MTPAQIQEVHRNRHILVTGVDSGRGVSFDDAGLQTLADLDTKVSVQCMPISFGGSFLCILSHTNMEPATKTQTGRVPGMLSR